MRAVGSRERRTDKIHRKKIKDGAITEKIGFYCKTLDVSWQALYDYFARKNKPWKYKSLVEEMTKIHNEDIYNDIYSRE